MINLAASGLQSVKCSYAPVLSDNPVGSGIHHEGASAWIAAFVLVVDTVDGGFDRRIRSGDIPSHRRTSVQGEEAVRLRPILPF